MKIQKIVFPVLGCLALMTSCDNAEIIKDTARNDGIMEIINKTKDKIDNFGLNLAVSNLNVDTNVGFMKKSTSGEEAHTTRVTIENGNANLGVKVANLIADGQDVEPTPTPEGWTKSKYLVGTAELSNLSAKGLYADARDGDNLSLNYDFNVSSLKGYFNERLYQKETQNEESTDRIDTFYFDINDSGLISGLTSLRDEAATKAAQSSEDTDYKEISNWLTNFLSGYDATLGKYFVDANVCNHSTLTEASQEVKKWIDDYESQKEGIKKYVDIVFASIDGVVTALNLPSDILVVKKNGNALNYSITLTKESFNQAVNTVYAVVLEELKIDLRNFISIPNVTNGSIKLSIDSDANGLLSAITLDVNDLQFDGAFIVNKEPISTKTINFKRASFAKLSGQIKLSAEFYDSADSIVASANSINSQIWHPFSLI